MSEGSRDIGVEKLLMFGGIEGKIYRLLNLGVFHATTGRKSKTVKMHKIKDTSTSLLQPDVCIPDYICSDTCVN